MKWIWVVLVGFCLISAAIEPVLAQSNPSEPQQAMNLDDAEKLRLQIKALTEFLQSNVPQEQQGRQTASAPSSKTVADVLDKALDMVSGSVATIAAGVEKAAPRVWRIMIVQQYANAVSGILLPWGLLALVVVYYKIIGKKWPKPTEPDGFDTPGPNFAWWTFSRVLPVLFGITFGIWGIDNLSDSLKMLINPEYYAIKDLIAIILQNNPL